MMRRRWGGYTPMREKASVYIGSPKRAAPEPLRKAPKASYGRQGREEAEELAQANEVHLLDIRRENNRRRSCE